MICVTPSTLDAWLHFSTKVIFFCVATIQLWEYKKLFDCRHNWKATPLCVYWYI